MEGQNDTSSDKDLAVRRFELDAEIQRRDIALKEKAAVGSVISPTLASVLGALLALISAIGGAYIGSRANVTVAEIEQISGRVVEEAKSKAAIDIEKFKLQRDLIVQAISKPTAPEVRNTLKFFALSGLINDYKADILAYLGSVSDEELPVGDKFGNLLYEEYLKKANDYRVLLDLIGAAETRNNYNAYFRAPDNTDNPRLTEMSISEVIAWQEQSRKDGSISSGVGRYMFILASLRAFVKEVGLTGNEQFNPLNQDILAVRLLERRGIDAFVSGEIDAVAFARNLAMEWASLPVLADTIGHGRDLKRGQSWYAGDALNLAMVSAEEMERVLQSVVPAKGSP